MITNIEFAADILRTKRNILVLTGAGISTASGIPDFRSKTGIYKNNPKLRGERILSREYFYRNPKKFYEFLKDALFYPKAQPNIGHQILAQWEQKGRISHIVTQNIDGLHSDAGSQNVIEFHGTMRTATCHGCRKKYVMKELLESDSENFFYCGCTEDRNQCIIKPDFVLFDESGYWLTDNPFYEVQCLAYDSDAILILGTSLQVYPFASIPEYRNAKTPIIIINRDKSPLDNKRELYVLRHDICESLEKITAMF
ncbi:NAD-dependent protein deacylase [Paenibacillus alkaliterrae]|uniref:NAD-dependent protein deacylase n=1 Tax=Paenibacillus alkaliterrae TaxID=320909 RepID=UPI001F3C3403|nr:NAD-dependent protein deacylase [Paenibacillus alkaliterrae]MCF2940141.1 NAD-dependent protein deacylase [Paenibacillus alkaliterrae]